MQEALQVRILYEGGDYQLRLGKDSRLSQLVAQFHLNCQNLEGRKVSLKYNGQVIRHLAQRLVDVVGEQTSPTLELEAQQRELRCPGNNVKFYENELRVGSLNLTIQEVLNLRENYKFLQQAHEYIQWMFPNHFKSSFNELSHVLTQEQAEEFRRNGVIGKRLYRAYEMFMDFLGIQVMNSTGDLALRSPERFELALVKNIHNHIRIRRLMACLSVVGFRRLAMKLINFLGVTIQQRYPGKLEASFSSTWGKYSNKDIKATLKNCGIEDPTIFEVQNPFVQDLSDTPYSLWRGYPNSKHGATLSEILAEQTKQQVFFDLFELLFPLSSRDIEDIKIIHGFESVMEQIVALTNKYLDVKGNKQQYVLLKNQSLRKFGLDHLSKFSRPS